MFISSYKVSHLTHSDAWMLEVLRPLQTLILFAFAFTSLLSSAAGPVPAPQVPPHIAGRLKDLRWWEGLDSVGDITIADSYHSVTVLFTVSTPSTSRAQAGPAVVE
jgi:hypothetical protein